MSETLHDSAGPADPGDHRLYFELTDVNGQTLVTLGPVIAPANQDARAPIGVQVVLAHEDGCSKVIQRAPIPPY